MDFLFKLKTCYFSILLSFIHECSKAHTNNCHRLHAICINQVGGYICQCENGFYGAGTDCSGKLFFKQNEMFYLVRGDVISTHQPYRADEKWESTYVCQPDQFVVLKFDTLEISKIANDILHIQLLTAEESEY